MKHVDLYRGVEKGDGNNAANQYMHNNEVTKVDPKVMLTNSRFDVYLHRCRSSSRESGVRLNVEKFVIAILRGRLFIYFLLEDHISSSQ